MIRWFRRRTDAAAEIARLRARVAELEGEVWREKLRVLAAQRMGGSRPAPLTTRGELLREKARADALEAVVHRLQTANMRADQAR